MLVGSKGITFIGKQKTSIGMINLFLFSQSEAGKEIHKNVIVKGKISSLLDIARNAGLTSPQLIKETKKANNEFFRELF
jgi:hypothetical protein